MAFRVPDRGPENQPLSQDDRVLLDALTVAFDTMQGHSPFAGLGDVYRIACQCLLRPATIEQARDVLVRSAKFRVEDVMPIEQSRVSRLRRHGLSPRGADPREAPPLQ